MDNQTRQLIAWAAAMIRDQDEICRSQIPNYGTFSQDEMQNLKALESLSRGVESDAFMRVEDHEMEVDKLQNQIDELSWKLDQVRESVGY